METKWDIFKPNSSKKQDFKFYCENCDYGTSKRTNFENHNLTAKHVRVTNGYKKGQKQAKNKHLIPDDKCFVCECGKMYKHRQGLWRHKNNCIIKDDVDTLEKETKLTSDKDDLIAILLKQNNDLIKEQADIKQIILEIVKNGTTNNSHNITNSNNKSFNLNFFLNETCKDAMNITDFVDSIKLQLSDLENVGELGYIQGISNIITTNLKALDIDKRPIHCTDKKRETLYIKDENKWEKEDDNKNKLRKVIRKIANKNVSLIQDFKNKYPDCIKSTSRHSDKYNKIIVEAMGGSGDNDVEKEDKIIKNISKATTIDKLIT